MMFLSFIDRFFYITKRGSNFYREIIAAFTVFGAMSYIMAVNPAILSQAGLDRHDMVMTTISSAVIGTLIMGLWARLPMALAPAMSSNVLFAEVVVKGFHVTPSTAFTIVFISGLLFLFVSLTNIRKNIISSFPLPIILGIQAAIGIFIARTGMIIGNLVDFSHKVNFTKLSDTKALMTLAGVVFIITLQSFEIPASFLISILFFTIIGVFVTHDGVAITSLPGHFLEVPHYPTHLIFSFDFQDFFSHLPLLLPITLYIFLSDFFDATGTLMTVSERAGLSNIAQNSDLPPKAYIADGLATIAGAALGTSTVSAYLENIAGAEAGAKTGLMACVVAFMFALSVFFWPLIICIPSVATAPILIVIGLNMMRSLSKISATKMDYFPTLLMIVITGVTGNFMVSLSCGMLLYSLTLLCKKRLKELSFSILFMDVLFIIYLYMTAYIL